MLKISKSKTLFQTEWLSLRDVDGYVYSHEEKGQGHTITVLGWRKRNKIEILCRFEICPAHGDNSNVLHSLTGLMEDTTMPLKERCVYYAQKELLEEAGIGSKKNKFEHLIDIRPSKSTDTVVHCYSVELDQEEPIEKPLGDGTKREEGSFCKWLPIDKIETTDGILLASLFELTRKCN